MFSLLKCELFYVQKGWLRIADQNSHGLLFAYVSKSKQKSLYIFGYSRKSESTHFILLDNPCKNANLNNKIMFELKRTIQNNMKIYVMIITERCKWIFREWKEKNEEITFINKIHGKNTNTNTNLNEEMLTFIFLSSLKNIIAAIWLLILNNLLD